MTRPIRTLLFSTLYPSAARPVHGIFVETRLRELLKTGEVETRVVAPVPWFPLTDKRYGEYAQFAATPRTEVRNDIAVEHPRYLLLPKVGMNSAPDWLARGALPTVRRLIASGFDFDLIDAHYYYPDGVAAAIIARAVGKPFVVTARGTDLNLIPQYPLPRQRILDTARRAAGSIGVCKALMDTLRELGGEASKLHVFRNGVDLVRFHVEPRDVARARLDVSPDRRLLLSVGHLIERKGHHLAIEALMHLPADIDLAIIGSGAERDALVAQARRAGVADRVRFLGQIPQGDLLWWYNAADILLLCSSREGWANVLLESMACGTPVVATNIWGTPEVVSTPAAGVLAAARSGPAMAEGVKSLLAHMPAREAVRAHAEQFSWDQTTEAQLRLFREVIAGRAGTAVGAETIGAVSPRL